MPRTARIVVPYFFYHVTQRGNDQQVVFFDDKDRSKYLEWMNAYSQRWGLKILAYCLMNNHVHFIVRPQRLDSLAKVYNTAHMRYAQRVNRIYQRSGHVWQGRFFSCLLEDLHLIAAIRYVERNPVRAGMVKRAWDWPWSSAAAHVGMEGSNKVELEDAGHLIDMSGWGEFLHDNEDPRELSSIRKMTNKGSIWGSPGFISKISCVFRDSAQALSL